MRTKSRLGALTAIACVLAMVAAFGASAGPPTFAPAQHVCETHGGNFIVLPGVGYHCEGGSLPFVAFQTGQPLCEHAYGGTFVVRPSGYICAI